MEKLVLLEVIIGLIILCPCLKQDWSSPAVLNMLWNSVFIVLAVVLFGSSIQWKYGGIIWILLSCIFFLIGQMIGECLSDKKVNYIVQDRSGMTNLVPFAIVCLIFIGMLNPIIYLRAFGYSVSDIFNVNALLSINATIASDRYSGNGFESGLVVMIGAISYCAALCGGYMFAYCKRWYTKILMIATVVPMIILTIITNAKVGTIAVAFLWITGWIISYLERNRQGIHVSKRLFICIVGGGIVFFVLLYLSMMLRIGSLDKTTKLIVDKKMQEYALGHIEAFTEWFHLGDYFKYEMGANTFMVFARYLGLTQRAQGVYDALTGVSSNIFTQNRGIIQDFGMVGGLLFWIVFGIIAGWCYKRVKQGERNNKGSMTVLAIVYFSILYGFIISPWIYTSYVAAIIGFWGFLWILDLVKLSIVRGNNI